MSIINESQLIAALEAGSRFNCFKGSVTAEGAGTFYSLWKIAGNPPSGANPATGQGETPTKDTLGAITLANPTGGNTKYIGRLNVGSSTIGTLIIYDRIFQVSGLVGNITTDQAINSVPLTRYTDGKNIEIFGEVYTAMGATGSTFTVTYVDSADATKTATYVMPANALTAGQMFPFIPADGGVGCKSITQVALTPSTGTAGNFGITLVRRVAEVPFLTANVNMFMDAIALGLPQVLSNACLAMMVQCSTTNTGNIFGAIDLIEG
jgi:hypothetical protein